MLQSSAYAVVTLLISWALTVALAASPERLALFPLLVLVPALTALIFRVRSGRSLLSPLIAPPGESERQEGMRWAVAISGPVLFLGACAVVVLVAGLGDWSWARGMDHLTRVSLVSLFVGFCLCVGEEYGWRGTLLPQLEREGNSFSFSALKSSFFWAAWHAPIFMVLARAGNLANLGWVVGVQFSATLVIGFGLAWVGRGGYALPSALMHTIWNLLNPALLGNILRSRPGAVGGDILLINGEGIAGVVLGTLILFGPRVLLARARVTGDASACEKYTGSKKGS